MEVWPENWRAYVLFTEVGTQWRASMGGPTGLDYNVLYRKLDRMGLSDEETDELERDVRVMEYAALDAMVSTRE